MAPEDMLSVTPEAMVKAIVQRRERMAKEIPIELEKRREENDRAYVLTNEAKQRHEATDDETAEGTKTGAAYDENETFRRRTVSRLWTAQHAQSDTEEALQFWKEMAEGNWGHLLEDAQRVEEGGPSSYVLRKQQKIDLEGSS